VKVLLDTHVFLWAITAPEKLSPATRRLIDSSERFWSVASLWEALIKVQVGKLPLSLPAGTFLVSQLRANGVSILPIKLEHALRVETLASYHRDPFDRMLIAQSLEENLPLITADPIFEKYPVRRIW
jgi:PIN domain nuclease of toxin-antitoxin system